MITSNRVGFTLGTVTRGGGEVGVKRQRVKPLLIRVQLW